MKVQAATKPATGRKWGGVYTPRVGPGGEGPSSWQDYFNQQKRWAYGIWEILTRRRLSVVRRGLTRRQRLLYGCVQFYYPSVAVGLLLGNLATALYLLFGVAAIQLHTLTWLGLWAASLCSWMVLWFWLRRFNIAPHEREEFGVPGMAFALFAGPVYAAAGTAALLRRPLSYSVTAKGKLRAGSSLATFRLHLAWAGVACALLAASVWLGNGYLPLRVWCGLTLAACLGPPAMATVSNLRGRFRGGARTVRAAARAPATRAATTFAAGTPAPPTLVLPRLSQASASVSSATLELPRPRRSNVGDDADATVLLPAHGTGEPARETTRASANDAANRTDATEVLGAVRRRSR